MRRISTSGILTLGAIVLLVANIFIAVNIHAIYTALHNDAVLLNEFGLIRGYAQRITNLELLDDVTASTQSMTAVDAIFDYYLAGAGSKSFIHLNEELVQPLLNMHAEWNDFKASIEAYRSNPARFSSHLAGGSEQLWRSSNFLMAQKVINSDRKTANLRLLYYYAAFLILSAFLFLFIAKSGVRIMEYRSSHDALTGVENRGSFDERLADEKSRFDRHGRPFALCIIDIDHFKAINDVHGHTVGDAVLKQLAEVMRTTIRKTDGLFRVGGEEFAVLAPDTDRHQAVLLAEKLRCIVEERLSQTAIPITISIGVAPCDTHIAPYDLYKNADVALYDAKRSGRNKVCIHGSLGTV